MLVSSRLLWVELHSAADRRRVDAAPVAELLDRVSLVTLDAELVDRAVALRSGLRALDALHLATVVDLAGEVDSILAFDRELLAAAGRGGSPHTLQT